MAEHPTLRPQRFPGRRTLLLTANRPSSRVEFMDLLYGSTANRLPTVTNFADIRTLATGRT